jgi:hypothetical protein
MPKHVFRLSLFIVLLALGGSIRAKEVVFVGTSMKTLAGLYKVTYGFAFYGHAISIAPDGTVTLKVSGNRVEHFVNGKTTYFSSAGFVVKFTDLKGSSLEMKFVYQKGYPTSVWHGPAGVTVFTRQ